MHKSSNRLRTLYIGLCICLAGCTASAAAAPTDQPTPTVTATIAPSPAPTRTPLPTATPFSGDSAHGKAIYVKGLPDVPPCITCHPLTPGGFALAPAMNGIRERAAKRIEGMSAETYLLHSIIKPAEYIVPGYRNIMFPNYAEVLTEHDLADLIAFLMTQ